MKTEKKVKSKVIGTVEKNAREIIKVKIDEYKGTPVVDTRVYFLDKDDEEHPTRKGLTFSTEIAGDMSCLLESAYKELKKQGLTG